MRVRSVTGVAIVLLGICAASAAQEPADQSVRQVRGYLGLSDSDAYVEEVLQGARPDDVLPMQNTYLESDEITALFVVSHFQRTSSGWVELNAGYEWFAPDGSLIASKDRHALIQGNPPAGANWAILRPNLQLNFSRVKAPGMYLLRVTINDEVSELSVTLDATLTLVKSPERKTLLNRPIDHQSVLDALWEDFHAHRDELALRRIATTLPWAGTARGQQRALGDSARESLLKWAGMLPSLLDQCRAMAEESDAEIRKALEAVIAELEN